MMPTVTEKAETPSSKEPERAKPTPKAPACEAIKGTQPCELDTNAAVEGHALQAALPPRLYVFAGHAEQVRPAPSSPFE